MPGGKPDDPEPDAPDDRRRFRPTALGLTGVALAAMAVTLLVIQAFAGGFRTDGEPSAPRPSGGVPAPPEGTARIMVAGDSVVQGSSGDFTWRYRLWRHLSEESGVDVDFVGPHEDLLDVGTGADGSLDYAVPDFDRAHAGAWGATAADVADVIGEQVAEGDPHYLLLMAGANDLVEEGATAGEALEHLREAVVTARVAGEDLRIVLGELTPMWGTGRDEEVNTLVAEFNAGLPLLAEQLTGADSPVVVAHTAEDYAPAEDNWDTTHPNARGELKIAAAFADALAEPLRLGEPYSRPLPEVEVGPRTAPVAAAENVDGGARLTWDPVPGATRYQVWQRRVRPEPDELVPLSAEVQRDGPEDDPRLSADIGGLYNGATYAFMVRPYKGDDGGVRSEAVEITVEEPPPEAPEWLRVDRENGDDAVLVWAAVPEAGHFAVWRRPLECAAEPSADGERPREPECEPPDGEGPGEGEGWTTVGVVNGERRWSVTVRAGAYEFAVASHLDFVEGGISDPVEFRAGG
ncbi:lysophospholipase L1-like esterase [Spinactinospora alkalitolerans]|uniref:Lysophospholipase L1-like esterase n=1 Tax=Spinactinospora alkalitolerans TaxID=687207 RepID=A0A852U074_9ACTN|nr:GDSL-type esterase/lipase family protein [Spinactinospora alkalitolerans]NYE49588.1 lysophospholipase L1-like esterase [Spinactinospora alkalitolerans]